MRIVVIWLIGILLYWALIYGATKGDREWFDYIMKEGRKNGVFKIERPTKDCEIF